MMNNAKILIKAGLKGLFKSNVPKSKGKKFISASIVLAFVVLWISLFGYNYLISDILSQMDALNIIISMAFLSSSLVSLFMCVYMASGYLFAFKDYDLLMSLPLKSSEVLFSKLAIFYIYNYALTLFIMVPSLVVYGVLTKSGALFYICALVASFFAPIIPMVVGSVCALILGKISSRFKATNLVLIIGSFVLTIAVVVCSMFINNVSMEQVQNVFEIFGNIGRFYPPMALFESALTQYDILSFLGFVGISSAVFFLFLWLFAGSFKSINSSMTEGHFSNAKFEMKRLNESSPVNALFKREMKSYFSSYIYVLNTSIGVVMMTIFSIVLAFLGGEMVEMLFQIPVADEFIVPLLTLMFCAFIIMTCTTAPSISLEGKNLWITKTIPVTPTDIFKSKILVNFTIVIPLLLISWLVLGFAFKLSIINLFITLVLPLLYTVFIALTGLMANLYLPVLEWKSQVTVVKQSMSVLSAMLAGMISVAVPVIIYLLLKPSSFVLFSCCVMIVMAVVDLFIWHMVKTTGTDIFLKNLY